MQIPAMQLQARAATVATTVLAVLASLLAGGAVEAASPAEGATVLGMVSFGDSVPSGARCGCTAYPLLYARKVAAHTGRPDRMWNYAYSGGSSASVLRQLGHASERSTVPDSAIAIVMTGANDFIKPFHRVLLHQQRARPAFRPTAWQVRTNVTAIIRTLHRLHPGIRVVVENYWNVVKDGRVGRATYGAWGMRKAVQATNYANTALRRAAAATGATYVSTRREFEGPEGRSDPTWLLTADGDHPNARGHSVLADGIFRVAPNG